MPEYINTANSMYGFKPINGGCIKTLQLQN